MASTSSWIIIGALFCLVAMVVLFFRSGDAPAMPDGDAKSRNAKGDGAPSH